MQTFSDTSALLRYAQENCPDELIIALGHENINLYPHAEHRICQVLREGGYAMVYSHYCERQNDGHTRQHPCIALQEGSLRDDFDFGKIVGISRKMLCDALSPDKALHYSQYPDGGWYALRLLLTAKYGFENIALIPEYLYETTRIDYRSSGQMQHDYVDPRNKEYQEAMQQAILDYLQETDSLSPKNKYLIDTEIEWDGPETSVIIPVKNRADTIIDAVKSALCQKTDFDFNVIVVDNGSTDETLTKLNNIDDSKLKIISLTGNEGLGIGGCWNTAVCTSEVGKYAIQLDSDDVYSSSHTLQQIVDKFRIERCAMVIGTYMMTDFDLNPIPPGKIDHAEWTDIHGADNALRINGLGAHALFLRPYCVAYFCQT